MHRGPAVNRRSNKLQGQTALFVACAANSRPAALYLASKGADVEVRAFLHGNVCRYVSSF